MPHFKALMTTIYPVPDITAAKAWYAAAFGVEPYFDEPFYVGFDVAGYELVIGEGVRDLQGHGMAAPASCALPLP